MTKTSCADGEYYCASASALREISSLMLQQQETDIVMPGLSGYELCQRIKCSPGGQSVPVILLTSLNDPMDIIRGLECGADNFITKPYEPDQLVGWIRGVLQNRAVRSNGKAVDRRREAARWRWRPPTSISTRPTPAPTARSSPGPTR